MVCEDPRDAAADVFWILKQYTGVSGQAHRRYGQYSQAILVNVDSATLCTGQPSWAISLNLVLLLTLSDVNTLTSSGPVMGLLEVLEAGWGLCCSSVLRMQAYSSTGTLVT